MPAETRTGNEMETRIFQVNESAREDPALKEAAEILRKGGLVAFPTETVYGLGANALDVQAVARIFEAKERPQDNPLILHISKSSELDLYCKDVPVSARVLAERFWPGPLTLVLHRRSLIPDVITAGLDTLAIRCPDHPVARALICQAGVPLAAPSANRSGRPSPTCCSHVWDDMNGRIEGIVDGGDCKVGVESTVLDLTVSPPRLLRPGGVPLEALEDVLGDVSVDESLLHRLQEGERPKAPGMKYRHYAPKAPVTVVCGDPADTAVWILNRIDQTTGVLCFSEYMGAFPGAVVRDMGKSNDPAEQARMVFRALRSFDETSVAKIYAQCPGESGLGLAVSNRLKKAAGFHVETVSPALPRLAVFGITGGTGAGKTSALMALAQMGACVIDCDAVYHTLLAESTEMRQALVKRFGDILNATGGVDRKKLGRIVFDDPEALLALNDLTHTFVTREVDMALDQAAQGGCSLAAIDAIALIESGLAARCHRVVGVIAPEQLRVQRLMRREGIGEDYALLRIHAQKPDSFFRENCHAILENKSDDLNSFSQTATKLFLQLLSDIRKEELK